MAEAKVIHFSGDSVILREGETDHNMYKIVQGNVEVYAGYQTPQEVLIGILRKGSCFGEFGLLLGKPSIYTVVAYTDVYLLRVSEEDLGGFIIENRKNIIDIMRNMANTMMTMRLQIDLLLKEIEENHKPDEALLLDARKAMRGYGMYRTMQEAVDKLSEYNKKERTD